MSIKDLPGIISGDPVESLRNNGYIENMSRGFRRMLSERTTRVYFAIISAVFTVGMLGPYIAPRPYDERQRGASGELLRTAPPSLEYPLGTTIEGYDVLSRLLYGAQPTVIAGILGGTLIISIGLSVGLTAGYIGGRVDDILMRATDIIYGVPLIPFALVLIAIFGVGFYQGILVIGLILWRGSARVIRSQVLQIRERPFVLAAQATGASTPRIILKHILPNVAPMAVLFFALGTGYTIIVIASLAFLGVTDPFLPSWGVMVRNAYSSGMVAEAWWWALPPGLMIAITVLSLFMFGRGYEQVANTGENDGDEAVAQAT